eukprot:5556729-Pyramimonas_sp.AAC.1
MRLAFHRVGTAAAAGRGVVGDSISASQRCTPLGCAAFSVVGACLSSLGDGLSSLSLLFCNVDPMRCRPHSLDGFSARV